MVYIYIYICFLVLKFDLDPNANIGPAMWSNLRINLVKLRRWILQTGATFTTQSKKKAIFQSEILGGYTGCAIGGAKELGVIHFPTNWGAKEPQNLPNHRVDTDDDLQGGYTVQAYESYK